MGSCISVVRHSGIWLGLAVVAVLVQSCGGPLVPDRVRAASTAGQPEIVVVRSSDNPIYDTPIQWFTDTMTGQVSLYTVVAGKEQALVQAVKQNNPALVFTLGSQATALVRQTLPEIPTVFAMVLDHDRLKITDQPQVAGVALDTSVGNTFAQFRLVMPTLKRVLAFHSQLTEETANRAKTHLQSIGIDLVLVKVANPDEVKKKFPATTAGIDAIWQINDPQIFTEDEFYFLRDKSKETRLPFFASLSEEFARAGATAAVSVDLTSLGAQVAKIANDILGGTSPKTIGVQAPIGAYLALNLDVAKAIGVEVPVASLNNINKIISSEADKARVEEEKELAGAQGDEGSTSGTAVADATQPKSPDAKVGTGTTDKPKQQGGTTTAKTDKGDKGDKTGKDPKDKDPKDKANTPAVAKPRKPRDTRTVVFYDPDANHEAILQITNWFSEFLRTVDPQLRLQPVRSVGTFERMARNAEADFAILPASYVQRRGNSANLVPLLVPSSKGDVRYRKVLFASAGASKMSTVAATTAGGNAADVTKTLTASGVKMDGVTIIPVSKDVDALLALVFGQVDAALVMPDSLEVIKTIQPGAENTLRKLQETKPIVRPPLCAVSDVVTPELQAKLVAAMKRMSSDAAGARAMRSLGLDAWVAFEPGMLK